VPEARRRGSVGYVIMKEELRTRRWWLQKPNVLDWELLAKSHGQTTWCGECNECSHTTRRRTQSYEHMTYNSEGVVCPAESRSVGDDCCTRLLGSRAVDGNGSRGGIVYVAGGDLGWFPMMMLSGARGSFDDHPRRLTCPRSGSERDPRLGTWDVMCFHNNGDCRC
jgi:hypothetical protein